VAHIRLAARNRCFAVRWRSVPVCLADIDACLRSVADTVAVGGFGAAVASEVAGRRRRSMVVARLRQGMVEEPDFAGSASVVDLGGTAVAAVVDAVACRRSTQQLPSLILVCSMFSPKCRVVFNR